MDFVTSSIKHSPQSHNVIKAGVTLNDTREHLAQINAHIALAAAAADTDRGASRVLRAVIQELQKKAKTALAIVDDNQDQRQLHDIVIELAQAGSSAKVAAEVERNITEKTRRTVCNTHRHICVYKEQLVEALHNASIH